MAGRAWGSQRPLCACKGSWQFDPVVEVVPNTGAVYAAYLNGFNVVFLTLGGPREDMVGTGQDLRQCVVERQAGAGDKRRRPRRLHSLTVRPAAIPWVAQSHDSGATWTQPKLVNSKRYYFAFDADVLHDGTVVFAEGEHSYSGPGGAPEGVVKHHVFIVARRRGQLDARRRRHGRTWESRASSRGARRTSTSATRRSRPTTAAISSSSTTAR